MKLRRTMMFVPGNNPGMVKDAHVYGSDSVMFDLEDSVALAEKDAARLLVYHALRSVDYGTTERVVRINGLDTPFGAEDLRAMVAAKPDIIRVPKAETAEQMLQVDTIISGLEGDYGIDQGSIKLMAAVESARGVLNAERIAMVSPRLVAIAVGAEDLVTNLRTTRSLGGVELLAARGQLVLVARACGIQVIDTVFTNVDDEAGFKQEVSLIKQLGFDGKSVIHPRQIAIVHQVFTPNSAEIEQAERVLAASADARRRGLGVIALDGKMIDAPIIDRARLVLERAIAAGIRQVGDYLD